MGYWTSVEPYSLMSSIHLLWSARPLAEIPMSFTLRFAKSGALPQVSSLDYVLKYTTYSVLTSGQPQRAQWCTRG